MQIKVTIEKMLCAKTKSGWYLFRAQMGGDGVACASIICKGTMGWEPKLNDAITLTGDFVVFKGERQFQFKKAEIALPDDPRGQLHYVCRRVTGIGPATEDAIWNRRGEDWRNLQYGEVRKMAHSIYVLFTDEIANLERNMSMVRIISWLESKGCTENMAYAAYDAWESDTVGIVNENCYRLAQLPNYSFKIVDSNIRQNFGITDSDPRRIKSAVNYAMQQGTDDGSTAIPCPWHLDACRKLLPYVADSLIIQNVKEMNAANELHIFAAQNMMSMSRDYTNEYIISDWLRNVATKNADGECFFQDSDLIGDSKFTPDETQLEAVKFAVTHKGSIINGGAGVGKTSVVKMIVNGLNFVNPKPTVKLCAPTGKAAARLKEASGIEAQTIHLMLGAHGNGKFTTGELRNYAIIVDEASMVDSALLAEVIKRHPSWLILVGDQGQLPPVGNGQPFHDIIELAPDIVRTLTKCYRNKEAIFQAATQIRNGNIPVRHAESENERWTVTPAASADEAQELICAWAKEEIIDFKKDIVLCPKNGKQDEESQTYQDATVNALNEKLLIIQRNKRGMNLDGKYMPGDRVINTKNYPDEKVWNGTTATVLYTDDNGIRLKLDIPIVEENGRITETVFFNKEMVDDLRYAYALTVHKSQGSQYRKVFIVILPRDSFQLDRSLIYTAITRAQEECVIVGSFESMASGIHNVRKKITAMQCISNERKEQ